MVRSRNIFLTYLLPILAVCGYLFMYVPIAVLVLFSFNKSDMPFDWTGFSTKWYHALWASTDIWHALQNSLIVASTSVLLSVTISLFFVVYSPQTFLRRFFIMFYASLAIPEIVLAVGLLSLFSFLSIPLGLTTLIAGHTLIGLGYMVPIVHARYMDLDKRYMEASLDLGASAGQTVRLVMIPLLMPSLVAGSLLVFVLSLDDFILSFFCSGGSSQTLPIYIFVAIRSGATPMINALSTILLVVTSLLVLIFSSLKVKKTELL